MRNIFENELWLSCRTMGKSISSSIFVIFVCCISIALCETIDFQQACTSSQTLTAEKGDIYSPGYKENENYPPNLKCVWKIPRNKKNIIFEVKYMDMEGRPQCRHSYGDQVVISFVWGEGWEHPVRKYCGSNITDRVLIFQNIFHNMTFPNMTDYVFVMFQSDFFRSGRGFLLHYQLTTESSLCGEDELQCKNSHCVPKFDICDLEDDCGDGTDEEDCEEKINQDAECGIPFEESDVQIESRIVGGRQAVPGSWPWQIDFQLGYHLSNGHNCGGSLINSQYVLTAAHCLKYYPPIPIIWRVHLGSHNYHQKDKYEQIRNVKSIHIPDSINLTSTRLNEDIAVIRLSAEVKFNKHVRPVCLPPKDLQITNGTICYTTGWGQTRGTGESSLLKQVPIEMFDTCRPQNIRFNPRTMICGDSYNKDGNTCHGDSGGPLVCKVKEKWYLVGIVSFGTLGHSLGGMCGIKNLPTVFQKVSPHIEWIEDIIKNEK